MPASSAINVAPRLGEAAVAAVDGTAQTEAILGLPGHVRDALARVAHLRRAGAPATAGVVVAGMGGSAVGARLAIAVLGDRARRPVVVADGYGLPPWTTAADVVLCCSYSGATEETLACYEDARNRGATLVVAATGGALGERAARDGVPVIALPRGLQPRAAVACSLVAALTVAEVAGAAPSLRGELGAAARRLEALAADWGPAGAEDCAPKALARRLHGTVPVITGGGLTAPVAYRWKCQLNENAKVAAFWSVLPEADHNEICGWGACGDVGPFAAVFLEDPAGHARVARRMALTAALARADGVVVERVRARGHSPADRVLSLVLLGDLVSVYLAVLRGADPGDISAINRLKASLS